MGSCFFNHCDKEPFENLKRPEARAVSYRAAVLTQGGLREPKRTVTENEQMVREERGRPQDQGGD